MRKLLIAVAVVVFLSVGTAVFLVISKLTTSSPPAESHQAQAPSEQPKPAKPPTRPRLAVIPPAVPAPEVSAASAAPAATASFDPNALLSTLKPEEQKALQAAQFAQLISQAIKNNRYQLPINDKLRRLSGANKLTEAQSNQLKSVMQNIKPQIDAAFKDSWAQQDQFVGQLSQLITQGLTNPEAADDDPQVNQKLQDLGQQIEAVKTAMQPQQDAFSRQVLAAMTPYLTPDQIQALNAMPAQTFYPGRFLSPPEGDNPPDLSSPPPPPGK